MNAIVRQIVTKTSLTPKVGDDLEFVLSDESVDRLDDVIELDGWNLDAFRANPIALFGHRGDFPIGRWANVGVRDKALRANLILADQGTSPRIDEIRALIAQQILRATSVGFRPLERKAREESQRGGVRFTKAELLEASLVTVPANPNALQVAKSLNLSRETLELVFGESAVRNEIGANGSRGESAENPPIRNRTMPTIAERIEAAQAAYLAAKAELEAHIAGLDDTNVSDTQLAKTQELNALAKGRGNVLAALKESEINLGASSLPARPSAIHNPDNRSMARPFNMPAKKVEPMEYVVRAGTVTMLAHLMRRPIEDVRAALATQYPAYGEDATKTFLDIVTRAASAPATTFTTGWAAELIETVNANFMETLMPKSVFPRLSALGLSLNFGRAGKISIPTRNRTPTIAGSFVGEGAAIPVRQGQFASQILVPKKMAVITTWTREIDEHSVPAIEGLLRQAVQEDTAVSLDSVLIDANPATAIRPAGLLNGVAALTATAGGGFTALVGDIKQLTGALLTGTAGHVRNPAWLMNPQQVNSAGLVAAPGVGAFPFRDEIRQGTLQSYPIIDSGTVPMGTVILVDAADFVVVGGEGPRFEISDQATLHEEDTTPLPIVPGSGTASAPVRSLWQTDSLALRLILPVNWTLRRTGVVAWTASVTW